MYSDIMERTGSGKSFTLPGRKKAVIPRTSSSSAAPIVQQGPSVLTEVLATDPLPRVLHEGDARTEYRRRTGEMKTTLHWNDRKLLLQEAEFLTEFAGVEAASVVYVGPSPGSHINLLSNMFPAVSFILIDPTTPACEETKRVKYVESRLTPDKVRDITARFCGRAKKTLLISNMKSSKSYSAKQVCAFSLDGCDQQTTNNKQQTTNNKQQTTNNKQQTTNNKQQTTNNKQQTTNNKQQTTNNKQQTTNNE